MRGGGHMLWLPCGGVLFLTLMLASGWARGGHSGGFGQRSFGGRYYYNYNACNQTCANGALPSYSSSNGCGVCADGSLPLCACANGARPICVDGTVPRKTPPCTDGSTPACAAGTVLLSRRGRGRRSPHGGRRNLRCSNGAQPVCLNGATPVYVRPCASNGGGPICADGSYVSRHG